jgi:hypothetical protein
MDSGFLHTCAVEDQASHPPLPCEARHLEGKGDNALVF